jgi:UDP-N-acetylglucosamine 2-epimerase
MTRIVSLVGARPQFVKLGPICRAIEARRSSLPCGIEHLIVHTGQHYDPTLSDIFFEEIGLPRPAVNLEIGSGPHGLQTGRMMERFESCLMELKPDVVLVYGDTNSTLAGALVTVKLGIPLVHLEAGLRSYNKTMPEEINRIATDHISDLLLAPTLNAMRLLSAEGLASKSIFTGDVNYDAVMQHESTAMNRSTILARLGLKPKQFIVVTAHRSENAESGRLEGLLGSLSALSLSGVEVVFPVHPRISNQFSDVLAAFEGQPRLRLIEPVGYLDMLMLVREARIVLTDSGGLQKEAFFLDTPCITLREETEWTETLDCDANILVGMDADRLRAAVDRWEGRIRSGQAAQFARRGGYPFGDGTAGLQSVDAVFRKLGLT